MELSRTGDRLRPRNRGATRPRKCALYLKKNAVSYCRPTGRLDPTPADLAWGSIDLAALEYRARRGEIILLYEDETIVESVTNQCAHIVFVIDSLVTKAHKAREVACMVEYELRVIVEKVAVNS